MGSALIEFEFAIVVLHFIVAFFLMGVILLQSGKGQDMASMFGGGGSQALFGSRGAATFLSKLTTTAAILFLCTSLSLATISNYKSTGSEDSVIGTGEEAPVENKTQAEVSQQPAEQKTGAVEKTEQTE